jgi:hypothetical protein
VPNMASGSANGHETDTNEELTAEVAELASEISEAKTSSRRKKLASRLPELASRSRKRSSRGLQSSRQAARKRLQRGGDLASRRVGPVRAAAVRGAQSGGSAALRGIRASGQFLAGEVLEMAPKVPVRSAATLRSQYPGKEPDDLATTLVEGAARASAGVGAAIGVAAAVPFIPTAAVELGVETLALVAIELKLVAELHEVYGMPAPGTKAERTVAYVGSWANRRGVRITGTGLALAVGSPMRRQLERRLIAKAGQSTLALAPLLAGAAAGAAIDHHETRRLGRAIRDDLRKRATEQLSIAK